MAVSIYDFLRTPGPKHYKYKICDGIDLGDGLVIDPLNLDSLVVYAKNVKWSSFCDYGVPLYLAADTMDTPYEYPPIIMNDWRWFIFNDHYFGKYWGYGLYTILMVYSTIFVITVALTVLSFLTVNKGPYKITSLLLKLSSVLASTSIIYFLTSALSTISRQQEHYGVANGNVFGTLLNSNLVIATLNLLSMFFYKLCQVSIVARLFERKLEWRIVVFVGGIMSIVSFIISAIVSYTDRVGIRNDNLVTLSPFGLLFDIALETCFAFIIVTNVWGTRKTWVSHLQMWYLALLTIAIVLLSPAMFLADVGTGLLSAYAATVSPLLYTMSTFVAWEWLERIHILKKAAQVKSLLGQKIYEDEQEGYNFAYYSVNNESNLDTNSDSHISLYNDMFRSSEQFSNVGSNLSSKESSSLPAQMNSTGISFPTAVNQVEFQKRKSFLDHLTNFTYSRPYKIYKKSKSIIQLRKRNSETVKNERSNEELSIEKVRRRLGLTNERREYVYNTKDIVFASDDDTESECESNNILNESIDSHFPENGAGSV